MTLKFENIQALINECLNHYAYEDAIFLSELNFALTPDDDAAFLLATSYYRAGQHMSSYLFLKKFGVSSFKTKFLLARCCFDLNKLAEVESLLAEEINRDQADDDGSRSIHLSFATRLLGMLCQKTARSEAAVEYFKKSYTWNPLLMSSYKASIVLGDKSPNLDSLDVALRSLKQRCLDSTKETEATTLAEDDPMPESVLPSNSTTSMKAAGDSTTPAAAVAVSTPGDDSQSSNRNSAGQQQSGAHIPSRPPRAPIKKKPKPTPVITSDAGKRPRAVNKRVLLLSSEDGQMNVHGQRATNTTEGRRRSSRISSLKENSKTTVGSAGSIETTVSAKRSSLIGSKTSMVSTRISADGSHGLDDVARMNRRNILRTTSANSYATGSGTGKARAACAAATEGGGRVISDSAIEEEPHMAGGNYRTAGSVTSGVGTSLYGSLHRNYSSHKVCSQTNAKLAGRLLPPGQQGLFVQNLGALEDGGDSSRVNDLGTPASSDAVLSNFPPAIVVEQFNKATLTDCFGDPRDQNVDLSLVPLLELMKSCIAIETAMGSFECDSVLRLLDDLPSKLSDSPWAMFMRAKAHYEMCAYDKAAKIFADYHETAQYRVSGLEVYSSSLWFLHKDVALSSLVQFLTQNFKNSPEAWCAAGNCFSLENEKDIAVKFFERAIQVSPESVAAYNLMGFELLELEEYDKSYQCFATAIRLQPRNYNSWFGLGNVEYKLGKLELAELYYRRALTFNNKNPVVCCHVSAMLQRQRKFQTSLQLLNAVLLNYPSHALSLYQKAETLFALQRFEESLQVLEELKQLVPKESKVYLLAGKVLKKLNRNHLALMNLSWATDLDPRGGVRHRPSASLRNDEEPVTALATIDDDLTG